MDFGVCQGVGTKKIGVSVSGSPTRDAAGLQLHLMDRDVTEWSEGYKDVIVDWEASVDR